MFLDSKAVSRGAMSLWMGTRCLFMCPLWQGVMGTVSSPPPPSSTVRVSMQEGRYLQI